MGGSTVVEAPDPINPAQVGEESLATQLRLAPDVYAAESTYRPQYAALDQQILADSLLGREGVPGLLELYGTAAEQMGQQQVAANTQQREADIADVARLGGQAREAYLSANPELARTMAGLESRVNTTRNWSPQSIVPNWAGAGSLTATGVADSALTPQLTAAAGRFDERTPLQAELERQATTDLANGGRLSTSELANAQQSARAAYAARGLNDSDAAINAEILQTDAARQAKLDRARTFAAGVDASGQQAQNANRGFALGVEDSLLSRGTYNAGATNQAALARYSTEADLSRSNSALDMQAQLANVDASRAAINDQYGREFQLASMLQGQAQDPFQMVLGRSGVTQQAQNAAGQASYTQGSGAKLFDPYNQNLMQIYGANTANQLAASTATANNRAAVTGSGIGALGQLGGSALMAKAFMACLPEGQTIDTPRGSMPIEKLRAGHEVIGYDGQIVKVLQKHEYVEDTHADRFLVLCVDVGGHGRLIKLCDRHRIQGKPAGELQVGDLIGGRRITDIVRYSGVARSYDILTQDAGYQIHGVPVNSMIPELTALAAKLATSN